MKNEPSLLDLILSNHLEKALFEGKFGLEKENVRVDASGNLALTPHPKAFGDKLKNPYITTDFSESQIEMITPPFDSIKECYQFLLNLHNLVALELEDEYLWPQSNPPILPEEASIPIADYGNTEEGIAASTYREKLAQSYGKKKQLISGIHFNFSLSENFLKALYKLENYKESFSEYKNHIYLKISRNFLRYRWLLVYLFGASPVTHKSYIKECVECMDNLNNESYYFKYASSFRNGLCGYRNDENYYVSHDSITNYIHDIQCLIAENKISSTKEYYSSIRLKSTNKKQLLDSLQDEGIEYLEIRLLDINPFNPLGISLDTINFIHLYLLFCLLSDDPSLDKMDFFVSSVNHEIIATKGRIDEGHLFKAVDEKISLAEWGNSILDAFASFVKALNVKTDYFISLIQQAREKINDSTKTTASLLVKAIEKRSYIDFHMSKAKEYKEELKRNQFQLIGYEDFELSTQILLKAAIKRGLNYTIIDKESNFIALYNDNQIEYIQQATKTSLDSYSTVLVMENKVVTKHVLSKFNINVPQGAVFTDKSEAKKAYTCFKNRAVVVKPKSTNYGLGITILKENFDEALFHQAMDIAFKYDTTVLVEVFVEGKEYRFFVLGDKVVGILHRVPANVVGDGKQTIRQLVAQKNLNPIRGKGYKTPLEKIKLSTEEAIFLKERQKTFDTIPNKGETVYLRKNSNVSTGGDTIDYTNRISEEYKQKAVEAAQAVGAKICGVDMIIPSINAPFSEDNYSIIELNFNPAIHIHCFPFIGKNRKLGSKILDLLGF